MAKPSTSMTKTSGVPARTGGQGVAPIDESGLEGEEEQPKQESFWKDTVVTPVKEFFEQPAVRRAMPAILAMLTILIFMVIYSIISAPNYKVLFPGMHEADRQAAVEALSAGGYKVRIARNTGQVEVLEHQYHEARIFLAGRGLPVAGTVGGLDTLAEQSSMTTSQFMEQARYQAAIERELAQTISTISTLASARVHLALPRQTPFVRERVPPKASVTVIPHPGRSVTEAQVRAIVNLVSASIPHLAPEHVAVIDQQGNLLTDSHQDPTLGLTGMQLSIQRAVEQDFRERVMLLLAPIFGEANIRTQTDVQLDFTQFESTFERFDRDGTGPRARSEMLAEERGGRLDASGIPGATANVPPPDANLVQDVNPTEGEGGGSSEGIIQRRSTRNFEIDRSIEHIRRASGVIERLSVAIVVDLNAATNGLSPDRPQEQQLEQLRELIAGAVGADPDRGDRVTLVTAPFEPPQRIRSPIRWWEHPTVIEMAKSLMLMGVFIIVLIMLVRPVVWHFMGWGPPGSEHLVAGAAGELSAEELEALELGEGESLEEAKARLKPKKSAISADMLDTANTYDDKVALVRMIVAEDAGRVAKVLKGMVRVL